MKKPGGYMFYPNVHATDGKPNCTMEQMQEWGCSLVSNHVAMKFAARAMLEFVCEDLAPKRRILR